MVGHSDHYNFLVKVSQSSDLGTFSTKNTLSNQTDHVDSENDHKKFLRSKLPIIRQFSQKLQNQRFFVGIDF